MEEISLLDFTEKEYQMLRTTKETFDLLVYLETRAMKSKLRCRRYRDFNIC